jgi:hypothetical protein
MTFYMDKKIKEKGLLEKSAERMTEIVQEALDKFPSEERKKKLNSYLSKESSQTSFRRSDGQPCKAP